MHFLLSDKSDFTGQDTVELIAKKNPHCSGKREDYLSWKDYFMRIAALAGHWSEDPKTKVGACIVNGDKKLVGVGWNSMPAGIPDDEKHWEDEGKHLYVCHAEMNAVLHSVTADLKGCTVYTTLFPCDDCTKYLIQTGIKKVVYYSNKKAEKTGTQASAKMLKMIGDARIKLRQHTPPPKPENEFSSDLLRMY